MENLIKGMIKGGKQKRKDVNSRFHDLLKQRKMLRLKKYHRHPVNRTADNPNVE